MSQLHKWTFDSFVERVQELSLAKKKFVESGFKTLLKEFDFDLIDPEAGQNLLKDVFLQPRNVYGSVFPEGFIRALFGDGELPCPEDKKRIKNEHIQSMSRRFKELCQDEPEPRPLFEEVCQAVQSVFKDVKADEAVSNLSIIRGLDVVSLEYVFRIITDLLPEKLFLAKDEIQKFFDDYAVEPKKRNTGILGFPQKPMLLVKMSTNILDYNDKIIGTCGERYLTETKFDGERIMVHKSRNIYKFYSRNGIDYSEKLGRDSSRHFAARIDSVFKDHVESCILDGELLVWDRQLGKLVGKNEKASDGKVYDVKNLLESKDDETCVVTRALCVFDVIHLNGYDLDDWTLSARLRQLHQMFKPEEMAHHTMFISNHIIADSRKVFLEYYNKAMTERLEGIVVKSLYSQYQFGCRAKQFGWFKVKPDYGAQNTLDLAVIAVKMEKSGRIHSVVVGALKSKEPLLFKVVGAIQPQMKRYDKERLISTLKGDEDSFLDNRLPDWMDYMAIDKNLRFVRFKNICVVEVRASGLSKGYLKFPSIVSIRGDKDLLDCDTVDMVKEYENSIRKAVDIEGDQTPQIAKKRKIQSTVPVEFKRCHVQKADGYEVCLIEVKSIPDDELTELSKMGLNFVANVTKNCLCVITENPNSFRMKGVTKQNLYHILNTDWLIRCKEAGRILPWEETDFIVKCENATIDLLELEDPDFEENVEEGDDELVAEDNDSEISDVEIMDI